MNISNFVCLNGAFLKTDKPLLDSNNRSFLYGDALFETIHANGTEPQFFEKHLSRLLQGMKVVKMEIPDFFGADYFIRHIKGVLTRNKQFKGARVRLTVFRNSGGLYSPKSNQVSFLIESSLLEKDIYTLNSAGLTIDIFSEILKPLNVLSRLKSTSSLLFVLAGIYKNEHSLDDCLLLNEKERICESVSSNLFLLKGDKFYTPSLKEGCLPGIMREVISDIIRKGGYVLDDDCAITSSDLVAADEAFLTNAVNGIRWILAFRNKRYYNKACKSLVNSLNDAVFGNQFI